MKNSKTALYVGALMVGALMAAWAWEPLSVRPDGLVLIFPIVVNLIYWAVVGCVVALDVHRFRSGLWAEQVTRMIDTSSCLVTDNMDLLVEIHRLEKMQHRYMRALALVESALSKKVENYERSVLPEEVQEMLSTLHTHPGQLPQRPATYKHRGAIKSPL